MAVRAYAESGFYHVMLRGNARQLIFEDDDDRRRFVTLLADALEDTAVSVLAWCLMDNHVHLVFNDPKQQLSDVMHNLALRYALYFNGRYGRKGHVFEGRYKSSGISTDAYLLQVVRYVLNNPVAAGVDSLETYPWSSYAEYAGAEGVTNTTVVLDMFETPERFLAFCREGSVPYDGTLEYRAVPDGLVLPVARTIAHNHGCSDLEQVKSLPIVRRDAIVSAMRQAGLHVKSIARLTGLSTTSVYRSLNR